MSADSKRGIVKILEITAIIISIITMCGCSFFGSHSRESDSTVSDSVSSSESASSSAQDDNTDGNSAAAPPQESLSLEAQAPEEEQTQDGNASADTGDSQNTQTSSNGHLVVIDAGHQAHGDSSQEPVGPGASETKARVAGGTSGVSTGIPEYELNLAVSLLLRDDLTARGYSVVMIRETNDINISNAERAQVANDQGADAFIRIHANGSTNSSLSGALTMCMTTGNPYNASLHSSSRALSECVVNGLCASTGEVNRGVQETDTMSGINWCTVPVTIVEMGFMTNPEEDELMSTQSYRQALADGIANGIDVYFKN